MLISVLASFLQQQWNVSYVPLQLGHTGIERRTGKEKRNTSVLLQLYLSEEDGGGMPQQKFPSAEKV